MVIASKSIIAAVALLAVGSAWAVDLFRVTATVNGDDTASRTFATAEQAINALRGDYLALLLPSYSSGAATELVIDYRGMRIDAAYPQGSPSLTFRVDVLNIDLDFNGATRDQSRLQLRDYLKRGDALGRIIALLAATSPVDPVAGNPASLQTRMVATRYRRDFSNLASESSAKSLGGGTGAATAAGGATPAPSSARAEVGRYVSNGLTSLTVGLPFSHAFDTSAERPLSLDGELQLTRIEGTTTYGGQFGLSYRVRANERWYLVPAASAGITGSRDLGSAGTIAAASLTSAVRLVESADFTLWMGNAVNWTRTLDTSIGGLHANPKLSNTAITNGLQFSFMPGVMMSGRWVELSLSDSRYRGSRLYDRRYNELGVAVVQARRTELAGSTMRFELSYLDATNSRGWAGRVHITF